MTFTKNNANKPRLVIDLNYSSLFFFFTLALSYAGFSQSKSSAIINVNIIPMDREIVLGNQTVLIRNGIIEAIGNSNVVFPQMVMKLLLNSDKIDTISVGKKAHLILLERNPLEDIQALGSLKGVMMNGIWLDQEKLDELDQSFN